MNKVLGMLGLAKRAGKVTAGEFLCEKAVKSGEAKLIIIASDISETAKKSVINTCRHYSVEYIVFAEAEELGKAVGKDSRMVVSVNDDNFKNAILSKIERIDEQYGR